MHQTSINSTLPDAIFPGTHWSALNSGNPYKLLASDVNVYTGSRHSLSSFKPLTFKYSKTDNALPGSTRTLVLGGSDYGFQGNLGYYNGGAGNFEANLSPDNLYADVSSGLSIYIFQRES